MNKTLEDLYKGRLFPIGNFGLSQEYFAVDGFTLLIMKKLLLSGYTSGGVTR